MNNYTLKERLESLGIKFALNLVKENPEKNLPKLMSIIDKLDGNDEILATRTAIWEVLENRESVWYQFIMNIWKDIDDDVRCKLFENFVINTGVIGYKTQISSAATSILTA